MSLLTQAEVRTLIEANLSPAISLYMPTSRSGLKTQENPTRLKNLLRQAEDKMADLGHERSYIQQIFKPGYRLVDDQPYWQGHQDGLAVFLADGLCKNYRLPVKFDEACVVSKHFHVKPLIPLLNDDGRFFVLAISRQSCRFLTCTRHSVDEVDVPGLPPSMSEALQLDTNDSHSQTPQKIGGERSAAHEHGLVEEDVKANILSYFQIVDKAIREVLNGSKAPLVFAGVESLFPIYKHANDYHYLMEKAIPGNLEDARGEELRDKAWPLVVSFFEKDRREMFQRYPLLHSRGQASGDLREILSAASEGRVGVLFSDWSAQQWGHYDEGTNDMALRGEQRSGDEDLLNVAAIHTLRNSGLVYAVPPDQVPGSSDLAAVYRY
ncbi:MAG: hypothetical protein WCL39_04450 [Armatimonadota bacterium]